MKSSLSRRPRANGSAAAGKPYARLLALAAILASAAVLRAEERALPKVVGLRQPVFRPSATAFAYSVELPIIQRTGVAFGADKGLVVDQLTLFSVALQTSVDLINNTNQNGVAASYQFSYNCVATACVPQGGFYRTTVQVAILPALGVFHQDDFVHYLATLGVLQPGADQGAVGTLLVTFSNLPSARGWEANAIGTTFSPAVANSPFQTNSAYAYNASLFLDSAETTVIGFVRNTTASPTVEGSLRSDVGVRNTDINGTNQNVTVNLSFYDTVTGQRVGNILALANIRPGEVRLVADVWAAAGIPPSVTSAIVFADAQNPSLNSPTIEGFVLISEVTSGPRFLTMLCADLDGCGN